MRDRTYRATLSPDGNPSSYVIILSGSFAGGEVAGTVAAARTAASASLFQYDDFFNEERALVEQTPNGYVTLQGSADLDIAPDARAASGAFAGVVGHCPVAVASSCTVAPTICSAADHGLTLTRR